MFKRMKEWFADRRESRQQENSLKTFAIFERLEQSAMIVIDEAHHRVYISSDLSALFMDSDTKWQGFMSNLHQYFEFRLSRLLWSRYFAEVENKALREAKRKYANLTAKQAAEVRRNARYAVDVEAVPTPQISPFDFVITSSTLIDRDNEIIVVGRYKDGEIEMVPMK